MRRDVLNSLQCFCFSISLLLLFSGCETTGSSGTTSLSSGPSYVSSASVRQVEAESSVDAPAREPLDIIVSIFDPGLPDDDSEIDEDDWPELRRAEARYMAVQMRDTLTVDGRFGAIRVAPDNSFSGDLYVDGEILSSNGEELKLRATVTDSTGKKWFSRNYSHRVKPAWYKNRRNDNLKPFQPIYDEIVEDIAKRQDRVKDSKISEIHAVADMRFAQNIAPDAFSEMISVRRGRVKLERMPAASDPMLQRVAAVRYRDQMFVDNVQERYNLFSSNMKEGYRFWQSQSCAEVVRKREARNKAIFKGVAGALLIAGAAAAASDNSYSGDAVAVAAGVAGAALLTESWQDSKEAKVHSGVINELASTIDGQLAPQIIEMEDQTVTLTGDLRQQTNQWRSILAKIWAAESLPEAPVAL